MFMIPLMLIPKPVIDLLQLDKMKMHQEEEEEEEEGKEGGEEGLDISLKGEDDSYEQEQLLNQSGMSRLSGISKYNKDIHFSKALQFKDSFRFDNSSIAHSHLMSSGSQGSLALSIIP